MPVGCFLLCYLDLCGLCVVVCLFVFVVCVCVLVVCLRCLVVCVCVLCVVFVCVVCGVALFFLVFLLSFACVFVRVCACFEFLYLCGLHCVCLCVLVY